MNDIETCEPATRRVLEKFREFVEHWERNDLYIEGQQHAEATVLLYKAIAALDALKEKEST